MSVAVTPKDLVTDGDTVIMPISTWLVSGDIEEGNAKIVSGEKRWMGWRQMSEVEWDKVFGRGKHEI